MSSMGASCARVYVMKKKAEEKLQRMEQERSGRREDNNSVKPPKTAHHGGGGIAGKSSKKVHPGTVFGVPPTSNSWKQGSSGFYFLNRNFMPESKFFVPFLFFSFSTSCVNFWTSFGDVIWLETKLRKVERIYGLYFLFSLFVSNFGVDFGALLKNGSSSSKHVNKSKIDSDVSELGRTG